MICFFIFFIKKYNSLIRDINSRKFTRTNKDIKNYIKKSFVEAIIKSNVLQNFY